MLKPTTNNTSKLDCLRLAAACATVAVAGTYGPVVKVLLLEAAEARATVLVPAGCDPADPADSGDERNPGTDPVLAVCTSGDWDRAGGDRPSLRLVELPHGAVGGLSCGLLKARASVGDPAEWRPQGIPGVVLNPNCRSHGPPAMSENGWA
ncbi:MAG: hypothetical protein GY842_09310 [bacterium]|nr:hypothetical protein [bacterium]